MSPVTEDKAPSSVLIAINVLRADGSMCMTAAGGVMCMSDPVMSRLFSPNNSDVQQRLIDVVTSVIIGMGLAKPAEPTAVKDDLHPSHMTRSSDASSFAEICTVCGAHDIAGGGWGDLAKPCPGERKTACRPMDETGQ